MFEVVFDLLFDVWDAVWVVEVVGLGDCWAEYDVVGYFDGCGGWWFLCEGDGVGGGDGVGCCPGL